MERIFLVSPIVSGSKRILSLGESSQGLGDGMSMGRLQEHITGEGITTWILCLSLAAGLNKGKAGLEDDLEKQERQATDP